MQIDAAKWTHLSYGHNCDDNDDDGDVDIHIIVETPLAPSLLTESKGLELVNLGVDMINIIICQ